MTRINIAHQNVRGIRSTAYSEKVMEDVVQSLLHEMSDLPNDAVEQITAEIKEIVPDCSDVSFYKVHSINNF